MNSFKFLRPEYLFLFIPFILLLLLFFRKKKSSSDLSKICSEELIPYMVVKPKKQAIYPFFLIPLTLSLMILSLSAPSWNKIEIPLYKDQSALLILLDLSEKMNSQDVKPSRIKRALYKIQDFLKMEKTKQLGLIVFSGEPFVVTPLTEDKSNIEAQLPALKPSIMPASGHRTDLAIKKGLALLKQSGIKKGSLLLLTAELSNEELKKSVELLRDQNLDGQTINLSIIGIGDEQKSPVAKEDGGYLKDNKGSLLMSSLNFENLQKLADAGRGLYLKSTVDDKDLIEISQFISSSTLENKIEEFRKEEKNQEDQDQGYIVLFLALPLFLLLFRRGILVSLFPFFLSLIPIKGQAFDLGVFFQNDDKKAEAYFLEGDYGSAKELFKNEEWKACSHYKLGEYESAAELFSKIQSADGLYNYGTAKAKGGEFAEAIKAYEKVLEIDPDHEDAKYNKEMIEEYLKQQSDSSETNKNKGEGSKDKPKECQQTENKEETEKENQEGESENQKSDPHNKENQGDNCKEDKNEENDSLNSETSENQENPKGKSQKEDEVDQQEKNEKEEESLNGEEDEDESENNFEQTVDERLLKRVKDDPSELLRRKFLQQYNRL